MSYNDNGGLFVQQENGKKTRKNPGYASNTPENRHRKVKSDSGAKYGRFRPGTPARSGAEKDAAPGRDIAVRRSGSYTGYRKKVPHRQQRGAQPTAMPVRISFIGGLNEIGKNITMFEYGDDAIVVDCGMAFPDDTMLGVDLVIPDFTYLENNKDKIKGIFLTHGHEDHIGSLPYLLKKINLPLYGTRLTLGLVEGKLREHRLLDSAIMHEVSAGQTVNVGSFQVEFINVNHSIPDAVGFAIHTPAGVIVHTGDFKIDSTPIHGDMIDLG
ncbi:MAG: ribonuclease J, partial [Clostridia bacterium]|nr:ribonuclease J [Clostridia bacterium]